MIQLRPPADADNYRVKAGRFGDRFYTDPLPADGTWEATTDDDIYPAISTVKKATGQDWSRAMAKRLAKAPSQLVEIGNLDSESERKARINLLSDEGLGQASGRGTIVHAHAEAVLGNRLPLYEMSEVVKPYIARLEDFFAAYNPTLVAAEFVAINRKMNDHNLHRGNKFMGYGGTGDAVVEIDGKLWLVDWKSRAEDSDHKAYAEEGAQVSAYGRADYWIVGDDTSPNGAKRIAPPDLAGGLIVSIKPDSYECFPIDLDEGFAYWTDLHAWWQARRSETRAVGRKWAPRVPVTSQLATGDEQQCKNDQSVKTTPQESTTEQPTPTDAVTATAATTETAPTDTGSAAPVAESPSREFIAAVAEADPGGAMKEAMGEAAPVVDETHHHTEEQLDAVAPTRASNRVRFDALPEVKKGWAREAFKRKGVDPRSDNYVGEVARILADIEQRPSLREAQEARAEQIAAHTPAPPAPDPDPVTGVVDLWEQEGGEAPEALVNEARLMFDMVIGAHGRQWTGYRTTEANDAGVPFLMSQLRSMKRAQIYLALTTWAALRGEKLEQDEAEGNVEFSSLLFMVDGCGEAVPLGYRLGSLTAEEAVKFAAEVISVVQSETGEQPLADSETTRK